MKLISIQIITVVLFATVFSACTDYRESEVIPSGISLDVETLSFPETSNSQNVTVKSGSKWTVSELPEWLSVQSVGSQNASLYEWLITLSAEPNAGYNRGGLIIFQAGINSETLQVSQKGKKGEYVAVESVSLSQAELSITVGENASLSYVITPSNASVKDVTWKSSLPSVATISQSGRVDAVAEGKAIITITTKDGSKTASCSVTVKPVSVSSVTLDKESITLKIGETATLNATVMPENAANKKVSWSSSNASVATVDSNGKVTGISVGSAKITVTTDDGGKTASCSVAVNPISVTGVSLNKSSMSLLIGGTEKLTATVSPSNATNKDVMWSSSNTSIATVDSNGNVSGIKVGTAVITVKTEDGGKTATCAVTVNPISVTGVSLNQTILTMTEGDTQTLTATITPSNATDKTVTWSSSNTSVATISSSGVVTTKSAGNSTITVTTNDGGKKATCSVAVKEKTVSVTGVSLDKTSLSMTEGDTYTLTATVSPSNATNKSVTWSSSSTSVATVSGSGVVTAKAAGSATITVTTVDGGKTATCSVTVQAKTVAVTGVSLDKTTLSMTVGDTQTLTATITPSNATDKSVTWSSSNTSVAMVSSSGVVTAKAAGSAMITVTTNDGAKKATCSVTVNAATVPVTGVSLDKTSLSMTVGDTQTLTATVTPSNATNKNVTWSSSNTSVATVDSNGKVSGIKVGTAVITVKTEDGGKTSTCSVTVNPISVTGVTLNETSLTMTVGDTQALTATVTPSNATDKSVTWSSSNTSVAAVSSSGVVTAKAAGSATITVTTVDGGKKATCSVSVVAATVSVTGVSLNKASMSLVIGGTERLTATVTPSNATNKNVTWSSSNTSVATVDSNGNVSAINVGTAVITVKTEDGGKTATCNVTVNPITVTGVSLNQTSLTMTVGDTQTLTATVTPSNATDKSVTWSSSNTSVATVSSSGVVSAKSVGNATITVTTNNGRQTASCSVSVSSAVLEAIDLGLSVKWASFNLGATRLEDFGDYYAWGETEAKTDYSWSTYKWCNGYFDLLTKYNTSEYYGVVDNKIVLELEDDVAYMQLGDMWRMPTDAEWEELLEQCSFVWTKVNEVYGCRFTSNKNGNSIFLPAAGEKYNSSFNFEGSIGNYWSSSLYTDYPSGAWYMNFNGGHAERASGGNTRYYGFSVRPVYGNPAAVSVSGISLVGKSCGK